MRIAVTLDNERTEVELSPTLDSARVGATSLPVKVVPSSGGRLELEIAGEKVVVEGWPDGQGTAPRELTVNGEVFRLAVEEMGEGPRVVAAAVVPPVPPGPEDPPRGEGVAIVPPMPGRVVEVRVAEGDRVTKGQVVVVLEAMKMRNEVPSPVAGVVRGLTVQPGSNVRAREPMLRVVPG